jgi:hypothetical protein
MAKILFTAFMADARNKVAGTVFSKNRYGAYTRTKVTPVNPQSTAQQLVRGRFAARSAAWRGLTEAQRQSWIDGAAGFPVTDIFGNAKILSGQALYGKFNLNLAQAGQAAITTCPSAVAIPSLVSASLVADVSSSTVDITMGVAAVPAGFTAVAFATPLYGAGISFVKNKYRFLAAKVPSTDLNPLELGVDWAALFGALVAGQKVSVSVFLVSNTSGQAGVPFSASTIVIA